MMRRSVFFIGIFFAGLIVNGKIMADLQADVQALLPSSDLKLRVAWCKASDGGMTAKVYDSEENVVRELTPASVFESGGRDIRHAYISQDGETVVFKNDNSDEIQTIKFDGTDVQTLYDQGTLVCTWQDPADQTQYFIASGLPSPYSQGTWAVGIADQLKAKQISTTMEFKDQYSISVDGQMMGGFEEGSYPTSPGLWPVPDGAFMPGECHQGCNFAMRPTVGKYEWVHFWDSHYEICVHNGDGTKKEIMDISIGGGEPFGTAFLNHPDYLLYISGEGLINPILFHLTSKKWVAFEDDGSGEYLDYSRPTGVFLPKEGVESRKAPVMVPHVARAPQKLYFIDGRLLPGSQINASRSAVPLLRIPVGNRSAAIIVGRR